MLNRTSTIALCISLLSVSVGITSNNNSNNDPRSSPQINSIQFSQSDSAITEDQQVKAYLADIQKHLVPAHKEDPNELVRMLSLDGGGLRGLIFLPQLRALEILTGKRIHELYDIIGGTSTGGIAAIGLSYQDVRGQVMPLKDLINVYLKCAREIFPAASLPGTSTLAVVQGHSQYTAEGLERMIKTMVGDDKFCIDRFKVPVLITAVDENNDCTKIFCSENKADAEKPIWQIARATSAAKTYFPHMEIDEITYVDGGHKENHPAKAFWKHYNHSLALKFKGDDLLDNNKLAIFSFGTGDIKFFKDPAIIRSEWGVSKISSTIQNLFSKQETETNEDLKREVDLYKTTLMNEDSLVQSLPIFMDKKHHLVGNMEKLRNINRQLKNINAELEPIAKHLEFCESEKRRKTSGETTDKIFELAISQLDKLNTQKKKLEEEKKQVIDAMRGPLDPVKDLLSVQAYYRSQTDPLAPELHEMSDIKKATKMFEKGLEMISSSSFKILLKALFRPQLNMENAELDGLLKTIASMIKAEVDVIDITDTKPLTMVSIIDDCHNKFETAPMPATYFTEILHKNGYADISTLKIEQLSALLKWTQKLLLENNNHWATTGSNAHSLGDNILASRTLSALYITDPSKWESVHSSIKVLVSDLKNRCLNQIVTVMKNKRESSVESKFNPNAIEAQVALAASQSMPSSSYNLLAEEKDRDPEYCAKKAFDEHIVAHLGLLPLNDIAQPGHDQVNENLEYLNLVKLLLEEIKFRARIGQQSTKGAVWNSSDDGYITLIKNIESLQNKLAH